MHTLVSYESAMTGEEDRRRGERLREARAERFESAADAARALGVSKDTYVQHENGTRGFKRVAERYAEFFRVRLEWLWTGRGDMRPGKAADQREMSETDFAKAFGRAPPGVQRIIEGILKEAGSLTDAEKASLEAPDDPDPPPRSPRPPLAIDPRKASDDPPVDIPYTQPAQSPTQRSLLDRPQRLRGFPGQEPPTYNLPQIPDPPKGRGKRKRK